MENEAKITYENLYAAGLKPRFKDIAVRPLAEIHRRVKNVPLVKALALCRFSCGNPATDLIRGL